jgi:hypothetical protein
MPKFTNSFADEGSVMELGRNLQLISTVNVVSSSYDIYNVYAALEQASEVSGVA